MSNSNQQAQEAADAMAPITRHITGNGKGYTVRRLATRQVWPTLRAALPIIEGLVALAGPLQPAAVTVPPLGGESPSGGTSPGQPLGGSTSPLDELLGGELASFLRLMAEHGERITEIVAIGLDTTARIVGEFEPQETYLALRAIIETNQDFFTHRVAPLLGLDPNLVPSLAASDGALGAAMRNLGAGQTPSSN